MFGSWEFLRLLERMQRLDTSPPQERPCTALASSGLAEDWGATADC
jgi:hypothetical protein